jgi:benzoyl-CoA reductase/2-hydroxyglutaryl-CoA dehydratase subunit BcrC/BadD/HgdB
VGFVDAMLAKLLSGNFDFLDYLIVPHTRKTIQAFYRELTLARSAHPELSLPELHYLDRAYTPFYTSEVFNRQSLVELRAQLETWCGHAITDVALAEAIEVSNASRRLLQQVAQLRAAQPSKLSGVDALQVIGTAFFMPKRDHNQLLESIVDSPPDSEQGDNPRLFLGGSPLDNLEFYALIESCGAVVIAEDHCWGNRCSEAPVDTGMPSWTAALAGREPRVSTARCSV